MGARKPFLRTNFGTDFRGSGSGRETWDDKPRRSVRPILARVGGQRASGPARRPSLAWLWLAFSHSACTAGVVVWHRINKAHSRAIPWTPSNTCQPPQTVPLFPFRGDVNPGCGCVSSSGFTGRMAVFCLLCPRFCRSSHNPADAGKLCQRRARVPILYARFRRRSANATSRSTAGDR
ncbi:hypothetical protein GQ607_012566 [Colletotrichum asianum]|uniref:Uncharacterized protein n=1 Tax=Colletotrichum asianum TaxID=702518 RepID=A0A8H3W5B8_9PEZI|nr:hypothetical protein GQ607_012566 [Colletotrichum asianum]